MSGTLQVSSRRSTRTCRSNARARSRTRGTRRRRCTPLERDAVFARTWQVVGRREQVAKPGAFLTADIAGEPVLVVRGEDGVLRAFFNVCRHRAAPVCTEECGTATKLRCRYHGWTYDLAGKLRGTPEFDGVQDFRKEDNGLPPVAVAEWGPFVWVHLTRTARTAGRVPGSAAGVGGIARRLRRAEVARPQELRPGVQLEGVRR